MKILLVEDDEVFHAVIAPALSKQGHEVTSVLSGEDALEKIRAGKFDLILVDILMPNKDGIDTIQEIRDTDVDVKIIAISAGGKVGYSSFLELAQTVGANACLEKPFTPPVLLEKIKEVMNDLGQMKTMWRF